MALNWGFASDKATAPGVGRVFVFKLGAKGEIPNPMKYYIEEEPKAQAFGTPQQIAAGFQHYSENCMLCHGTLAICPGVVPDLRWSGVAADKETWNQVVREGILTGNGMVSFKNQLTPDEVEAIRA